VIDLTSGVTSQDKRIAGLIQEAEKPCVIVLNKWDLMKPARGANAEMERTIVDVREQLFFLDYAPVLVVPRAHGRERGPTFSADKDDAQSGPDTIGDRGAEIGCFAPRSRKVRRQ